MDVSPFYTRLVVVVPTLVGKLPSMYTSFKYLALPSLTWSPLSLPLFTDTHHSLLSETLSLLDSFLSFFPSTTLSFFPSVHSLPQPAAQLVKLNHSFN